MNEADSPSESPLHILRELQEKQRSPESISAGGRRACVEHLHLEGYTPLEMAEIFSVAPRTIQRDLERIRQENALVRDPALAQEVAGEVMAQARASMTRLRRAARDRNATHSERTQAELASWHVHRESVQVLQSLGFLPLATHKVEADLTHHVVSPTNAAQHLAELSRVREILDQTGWLDDNLRSQLKTIEEGARTDIVQGLLASPQDSKDSAHDQS